MTSLMIFTAGMILGGLVVGAWLISVMIKDTMSRD